jgi:hypothetical protein
VRFLRCCARESCLELLERSELVEETGLLLREPAHRSLHLGDSLRSRYLRAIEPTSLGIDLHE